MTDDKLTFLDGSDFLGKRLTVQFARGSNRPRDPNFREGGGYQDRPAPRTRRTIFRMTLTGLPAETSWQVGQRTSDLYSQHQT